MKKGAKVEIYFTRDGKFDVTNTVDEAKENYFMRLSGIVEKTSAKAIFVKNELGTIKVVAKSILVELNEKNMYKAPQWASK